MTTCGNLSISNPRAAISVATNALTFEALKSKQVELGGLINSYKSGDLQDNDFLQKLIESVKGEATKDFTLENIKNSWNAMCEIDKEVIQDIKDILLNKGITLHVIGVTNNLQHDYILEQLRSNNILDKENINPRINFTLSFKQNTIAREELVLQAKGLYGNNNDNIEFVELINKWDNKSSKLSEALERILDIKLKREVVKTEIAEKAVEDNNTVEECERSTPKLTI